MIWNTLRRLISNPMGLFVYGILSKWYIMITVSAIVVTFWVFKGLEQAGVLQEAQKVLMQALNDTKSVARYCTPKIANLSEFWSCLSNLPDKHEATQDEIDLEKQLNDDINKLTPPPIQHINDPYDPDSDADNKR